MSELLGVPGTLCTFGLALLIFGLAPGLVLALVVKLLARDDPRRHELQAELYIVPRWERPFWVCEQLEVALREGVFPQVSWYWGAWVWHRAKVERGLDWHRRHPDTFWVPGADEKAELLAGDTVRLMWSVKRYAAAGERMWVEITERKGDRLEGRLKNWALFVHLSPEAKIRFHIDDIIDCHFHGADDHPGGQPLPTERGDLGHSHTSCNGHF